MQLTTTVYVHHLSIIMYMFINSSQGFTKEHKHKTKYQKQLNTYTILILFFYATKTRHVCSELDIC